MLLSSPLRLAALVATAGALLLVPSTTQAQTDEGTDYLGGGKFDTDIKMPKNGITDPNFEERDAESQKDYFNLAHCECKAPFKINVAIEGATGTLMTARTDLVVGDNCTGTFDNEAKFKESCLVVTPVGDVVNLQTPAEPGISVRQLITPIPDEVDRCDDQIGDQTYYLLLEANGEYPYEKGYPFTIVADTRLPPISTELTEVAPLENGGTISWKTPTSDAADVAAYRAFCATATGNGPAKPTEADLLFETGASLCPGGEGKPLEISPGTIKTDGDAGVPAGPDAGIIVVPTNVTIDKAHLCGTAGSGATSISLAGLDNGVPYSVVVVAVDLAGNAKGVLVPGTITPAPATDFWEDLTDNSDVQGGMCLLATTYGDDSPLTEALRDFRDDTLASTGFGRWLTAIYYDHVAELGGDLAGSLPARIVVGVVLLPVVLVALAWHLLTLPGLLLAIAGLTWLVRRRRAGPTAAPRGTGHRVLALAMTAAALLVVAPGTASAQLDPYWEDEGSPFVEQVGSGLSDWRFGLKVGPYLPSVDDNATLCPNGTGPYQQMFVSKDEAFGGAEPMPMMQLDRFFLHPMGDLGLSMTAGYTGASADAWADGSDAQKCTSNRPRAKGNTTSFRLVPLSLGVTYRYTGLDDRWGIPVVPYVRAAGSYYIWWIRAPNGDLASARPSDCDPTGPCSGTVGRGASLGVEGTIGLSVRAERLDPDSASSMRDSGIEHAGFFIELMMAKVDGFGSSTKMSVGDTTWFAGFDFEF